MSFTKMTTWLIHAQNHELHTIHMINIATNGNFREISPPKQSTCKFYKIPRPKRHTACGLGNSLLDSPAPKGASEPAVNAKACGAQTPDDTL